MEQTRLDRHQDPMTRETARDITGAAPSQRPRVSFIMAAYNAAAFLERAVQSARDQTMPDWQLVIIDDASSDDTLAIAQAWAARDPRIVAVTKPHGGLADTRNWGLTVATGEWCMFHDADDWLDPRCLEQLLALKSEHPDAGACACAFTGVDGEGRLTTAYGVADLADPLPVLVRGPAVSCISVIVKTDTVRAVGGFDGSLLSCEDWDLWLRLARIGVKFVSTRENLAYYRKVPGSLSTKTAQMIRFGLEVMDRAFKPDARLAAFDSPYCDGYPQDDALDVKARSVIYNTAVGLGIGHDPAPLIGLGPDLGDWNVDAAEFSRNILAAIAHGLAAREEDVAAHWSVVGPALVRMCDAIVEKGGAPRQAAMLRAHVEARALGAQAFAIPASACGVLTRVVDLAEPIEAINAPGCEAGVLSVRCGPIHLGVVDAPLVSGRLSKEGLADCLAYAARDWPLEAALEALRLRTSASFWSDVATRLADLRRWDPRSWRNLGQLKHDAGFMLREEMRRTLPRAVARHLGCKLAAPARLAPAPTGPVVRSGAILLYAAIDTPAGPPEKQISIAAFDAHLNALKQEGLAPITLAQWTWLQRHRLAGRTPPLTVAIDATLTGPDSAAWQALARHAVAATVFASWDEEGRLAQGWTWEQLSKLSTEGHEIGLHSSALGPIRRMTPSDLSRGLTLRLAVSQSRLGARTVSLMTPGATSDSVSLAVARQAGLASVVRPRAGFNWLNADPLDQSALRVWRFETLEQVRAKFKATL